MKMFHVLAIAAAVAAGGARAEGLLETAERAARYRSGGDIAPIREMERRLAEAAGRPEARAGVEAALIRMLADDATFEARRFACEHLAVHGTEASVPALARLLGAADTAGIACAGLAGIAAPAASAALRAALPAAAGGVRVQIVSALGFRGDVEAVPAIAAMARDADTAAARAAIAALGRIPSAPARAALAALRAERRADLADDVAMASLASAARMAAAGERAQAAAVGEEVLRAAAAAHVRRGAYGLLLRLDPDGGMARARATLSETPRDAVLTPVAIARVPMLRDVSVSSVFGAMVPALPAAERIWMIEALAARGDAAARAALRRQADSDDAATRRAAIAALGRIEGAAAVPWMVRIRKAAPTPADIEAADQALAALGGGAATDAALASAMKRERGAVRAALIHALARRGARGEIRLLLEEMRAEDPDVARAALQALAKLGSAGEAPALAAALAVWRNDATRADAEIAAARALSRVADPSARSAAVRGALAAARDPATRASMLRLLPAVGDAGSLAAVRAALADADAAVRDAAVRALAAWLDPAAWDALSAVLARPESEAHRALAFQGLARLAGLLNPAADDALMARYRSLLAAARSDEDRKLVLSALAGAAHPGALEMAMPMLDMPAVRAEAILALKRIIPAVKAAHPKEAGAAWQRLKEAEGTP